jgi:hypothetical protein
MVDPVVVIAYNEPVKKGQAIAQESIPVVLPPDQTQIPVYDTNKPISELQTDQFGFSVNQEPYYYLQNVLSTGIDPNIWFIDTDTGKGTVTYVPEISAAEFRLSQNDSAVVKQTKYAYQYQPGKEIDTSYAIQVNKGAAASAVMYQWGNFTRRDGYGWRLLTRWNAGLGHWESDLYMFRRSSAIEGTALEGLTGTVVGSVDPSDGQHVNGAALGDSSMFRPTYLVGATGADTKLIDVDTFEEIIHYSQFNRDKLTGRVNDGNPSGVSTRATSARFLSLLQPVSGLNNSEVSNIIMFLTRFSWYGASGGSGHVYCPDQNSPSLGSTRWVQAHEIRHGDTLPVPTMESPNLPITFQVAHRRDRLAESVSSAAFMRRYGVSCWIPGGDPDPMVIGSYGSPIVAVANAAYQPILAIAVKSFVFNRNLPVSTQRRPQKSRVFPLSLSIAVSGGIPVEVYLLKNPTSLQGAGSPNVATWYALTGDAEHLKVVAATSAFTGTYAGAGGRPADSNAGKLFGAYYCAGNGSAFIDLQPLFSPKREQLGRAEQVAPTDPGDVLVVIARTLVAGSANVSCSLTWGEQ